MTRGLPAGLIVTLALAFSGCGDSKESHGGSEPSEPITTAAPATGEVSAHKAVLACMKAQGLDAKDQTSSSGEKVGVDYPEGRLIVSFQETEDDAAAYAGAAESAGDEVVVNGTVVITAPKGGEAEAAVHIADECVSASG